MLMRFVHCSFSTFFAIKEETTMAKIIHHRFANNVHLLASTPKDHAAEGDLVNVHGKLFMFHPGGIWTFFMTMPLFLIFSFTWNWWRKKAWPYEDFKFFSERMNTSILMELKNVTVDALPSLPVTLLHVDTYDLCLALQVKEKFSCKISVHTLFACAHKCLILKSPKGFFKWYTYEDLQCLVDVLTPTYQLSTGWLNPLFWKTLRKTWGKPLYLGGGFKSRFYWLLSAKFWEATKYIDGYYSR